MIDFNVWYAISSQHTVVNLVFFESMTIVIDVWLTVI